VFAEIFLLARQVLYHLSYGHNPIYLFSVGTQYFLMVPSQTTILPLLAFITAITGSQHNSELFVLNRVLVIFAWTSLQ
jgi:hypothetical protein